MKTITTTATTAVARGRSLSPVAVTMFIVLAVAALRVLLQASRTANVATALLLVLVGALLALGAVYSISKLIDDRAKRARGWRRGLGWLLLGGGMLIIGVAYWLADRGPWELPVWGPILVAMVGGGITIIAAQFLDARIDVPDAIDRPDLFMLVGGLLVVGGALVASGVVTGQPSIRFMASLAAGIGLVLVKTGLPGVVDRWPGIGERPLGWLGWLGLGAVVAGTALMYTAPWHGSWPIVLAGVAAVIIGLSMVAEAALRFRERSPDRSRRLSWRPLLAGLALLQFGGWWTIDSLGEWVRLLVVLCLVLMLAGAFFVIRGEGPFAMIVVAFLVTWALFDRTGDPAPDLAGGAEHIVLVLGDSYSAGQGAYRFYDGFNSIPGADDPPSGNCRRSPTTYGSLLADELSELRDEGTWAALNLACSGAEAEHISLTAQHERGSASRTQLAQLAELPADVRDRIDLVVMTIGGNDSGFATVVTSCLLPADCAEQAGDWMERARTLGPAWDDPDTPDVDEGRGRTGLDDLRRSFADLERELAEIRPDDGTGAGGPIPVVLVPYPQVIDRNDCQLAISDTELTFVTSFIRTLDSTLVAEATRAGIHAFPGGFRVLQAGDDEGREPDIRLCNDTEGVNFVHLLPHEGSLLGRLSPTNWKDGTLHPRAEGHARLASRLAPWVRTILDREAGAGSGAETAAPSAGDHPELCLAGSGPGLEAVPCPYSTGLPTAGADFDPERWIQDRLTEIVGRAAPAVVALLAGGLLLAMAADWARVGPAGLFVSDRDLDPAGNPAATDGG